MIVPTYETTCKEQEITINELRSINRTQENRINIQKEEIKALKEELSECIEFQVKYDIAIVKCAKLEQEIERLNNIINDLLKRQNEALNYISNFLSMDNRYKHGNGNDELELVRRILNKHNQELKRSDKE